jgi:hypothetical protein
MSNCITSYWFFALGIAAESPQRSEDLQRKARPEGNAINLLLFM